MVNETQAAAWGGQNGQHFVAERERHDRMHRAMRARLLSAAAITAGEAVLDVGCGCGASTRSAARASGAGRVLGVDVSEPMLAEARRLAREDGLARVEFRRADAQTAVLPAGAFDVAISSFGVMFFDDPQAAFANVGRALRPGGRLAVLSWQPAARNEHLAVPIRAIAPVIGSPELAPGGDGPGPFSLADPEHVRRLLLRAGFNDVQVAHLTEPMTVGVDLDDALGYYLRTPVARELCAAATAQTVAAATDRLRETLARYCTEDGVQLSGAALLVTAHRGREQPR
jgi:SAM-dependent methyltransferase